MPFFVLGMLKYLHKARAALKIRSEGEKKSAKDEDAKNSWEDYTNENHNAEWGNIYTCAFAEPID